MGTEFQLYKMESVLGMDSAEDCTTLRGSSRSPNCTLENGEGGEICILPQEK